MTAIKHAGQRVGVFIDAQNLYHSAKNLYGKRVDFASVVETAVGERTLIRALAYVITTESGEESEFFEALTQMGIETKSKDLQIFIGGNKKADWDVGLAIDAVKSAPRLDTIVIVSGDGDFIPLVTYLQHNQGCQVEVISFKKSSSTKLIETCDNFIDLGEEPKKYLLHRSISRARSSNKSTATTDKRRRASQPKRSNFAGSSRSTTQNKPQAQTKAQTPSVKPTPPKPRKNSPKTKKSSTSSK